MVIEKYNNNVPYPSTSEYYTYFVYHGGEVIGRNIINEEKDKLVKEYPKAKVESVFNEEAYKEQKAKHSAEEARIMAIFWDDLAEEHGVTYNPKRSLLEGLAWEKGHYAGLSEVAIIYEDLVDLIK